MKWFRLFKTCFFIIFALALLIGGGLRTFWSYGTRVFWLGETILSLSLMFTGVSILVALTIRPQFVFELRSNRNKRGEIKLMERIVWYLISLAMILVGGYLSISFLEEIQNCVLPGC